MSLFFLDLFVELLSVVSVCANIGVSRMFYAFLIEDVLLLDLKMPDLNGLEVLAKVKEDFPSIEVIILTGHGSFEAGKEGMDQGAFDYIMKPVDLSQLITKIEEAYLKGKAS